MRLGITGTANSHADHFIRLLNVEQRYPGYRIVALEGGRTERNLALASAGGIDIIVDTAEDLLPHVDGAIVTDRDGAVHLAQSAPLLNAGRPVFIDKPLAADVEIAKEILALAAASGAPVCSFSALRFAPEVLDLADVAKRSGGFELVRVFGPADPRSEHSGLFFYGSHAAEIALTLAQPDGLAQPDWLAQPDGQSSLSDTAVRHESDRVVICATVHDVHIELILLDPTIHGHSNFIIETRVAGGDESSTTIVLGNDYLVPAVQRFLPVLAGETPAPSGAHMLQPIELIALAATPRHL